MPDEQPPRRGGGPVVQPVDDDDDDEEDPDDVDEDFPAGVPVRAYPGGPYPPGRDAGLPDMPEVRMLLVVKLVIALPSVLLGSTIPDHMVVDQDAIAPARSVRPLPGPAERVITNGNASYLHILKHHAPRVGALTHTTRAAAEVASRTGPRASIWRRRACWKPPCSASPMRDACRTSPACPLAAAMQAGAGASGP